VASTVPPEILLKIFRDVAGDDDARLTFASAALVCRSWSGPGQEFLYALVDITWYPSGKHAFLDSMNSRPSLAPLVCSLTIAYPRFRDESDAEMYLLWKSGRRSDGETLFRCSSLDAGRGHKVIARARSRYTGLMQVTAWADPQPRDDDLGAAQAYSAFKKNGCANRKIGWATLYALVERVPKLRTLELDNFDLGTLPVLPSLENLSIGWIQIDARSGPRSGPTPNSTLADIAGHLPRLRKLTLRDLYPIAYHTPLSKPTERDANYSSRAPRRAVPRSRPADNCE
jgi:hypothetical protein